MKKTVTISVLLALAIILITYFAGASYFEDRFLSNVYINRSKVAGMNLKEAEEELGKISAWNNIIIKSDKMDFLKIRAEDIDYEYIKTPDLIEIFNQQNHWKWFLSFFKDTQYTTVIECDYDREKVKSMIESIDELDKEARDAKIVYSDSSHKFKILPHHYGIKIGSSELFEQVIDAIDKRKKEVNVENYIEEPLIYEDDESLKSAVEAGNNYIDVELKYDFGDREELVDSSLIKDWIVFDEGKADIDPARVREYVSSLGKKYDTYGRKRKFKTTSAKDITISGGSYGWLMHRGKTTEELIEYIRTGENKTIEPAYSFRALIRDADDIGNSYVEIDLEEQMVYVYVDGELKVETQSVTGNTSKGYGTPTGVYPINYKETNAILTGEDYASPVDYWMPFNRDIGLHDAVWRESFGEDIYETDGSHGCINLPPEKAELIFDIVYPGMPVIVH